MKMIVRKLRLQISSLAVSFVAPVAVLVASVGSPAFAITPGNSETQVQQLAVSTAIAFQDWTDRYLQASSLARDGMQDEGINLAKQRRAAMRELITVNPAEALALASLDSLRSQLPAGVVTELESRVSGIGDLSVLVFCPRAAGMPVPPMERWVKLNGQSYRAYVYGRRLEQTSKLGIPLNGIVIDGVIAVDESPVRELAPGAVQGSVQPAAGSLAPSPGANSVVAEVGGRLYRFDSVEHLQQKTAELEAAEANIGAIPAKNSSAILDVVFPQGGGAGGTGNNPPTPWTTGLKRILIIRVDFSDLPGDPSGFGTTYTAPVVQGVADNEVSPFYATSSYGLTTLSNLVTTQLYRMPKTASEYATAGDNDGLHADAETLAAADYNLADYDRVCVLFSDLSGFPGSLIDYGGLAMLGGRNLWVNGEFDFRVFAHELGHTYGLLHAGLWQVADGNPISPSGGVIEYGDDSDTMGANFANDHRTDFNPFYKNILGWLSDSQVQTVSTQPATYRIYTFDFTNYVDAPNAPLLGLRIVKDNSKSYWVGVRHNFANNPAMQNGVSVIWGYNTPGGGAGGGFQSALLDMATPGISQLDSPLRIGRTFTDADIGISILPSEQGGSNPNRYVDIQINGGSSGPRIVLGTNFLSGGNANGVVDFNECNDLFLVLTNVGNLPANHLEVTLSTTTPGVSFGVRNVSYGDVAALTGSTNAVPFTVSTAPFFVCGTPIQVNVLIKSDELTSFGTFTLTSGLPGAPKQYDNSTPVAIPDANTNGANSIITVSNLPSAIRDLTVSVHLTHTFDADLYFELIGPDGTKVLLSRHNGLGGDNYGASCSPNSFRTTFDDKSSSPINAAAAPFVGVFKPEEPLAAFIGKSGTNVNGNWRLHVVDDVGADIGTLQCWSLFLSTATCADGGGTCPGAELGIGLSDAPDPVFIGSNLVYTITVTNNGPSQATNVVVNQLLPSSVVFVTASTSQGSAAFAGGTVIATLGTLPFGGKATINVTVIPTLATSISSTATITSEQPDPDTANNSVTISTQVAPPASDIAVGLFDAPDPVLLGQPLTYTVSVTNNGPSTATGVTVTNTFPVSALIQSATPSQGNAVINGNVVIVSFGNLTNAGRATATVIVTPGVEGTLAATAVARANQADPQTANNTATSLTVVGPAADLVLTMTDTPDPVVVRSNWVYTITVTNNGPSVANSTIVNQSLPSGVKLVSTATTSGSVSGAGNVVTANLGALAKGAGAVITVTVNSTNTGTFNSSVAVTAAQTDAHPENNSAEATTLVALPFVKIEAAGATLTAESFSPPDGGVAVGETVTVQLRLRNAGNVSNTNLTATLLATGGVTAPSPAGPVAYGILSPGGLPTSQPFTFTASGTNGGTVTATLQLQDGGNSLTNVTFSFTLPKVLTFSNVTAIDIPSVGNAAPYPSTINVSGITGLVGKVTATLSNFTHSFPQDLDVLLVAPGNSKSLLMASAGAPFASGLNVTFDDGAALSIPQNGSISSGSYRPASYGSGSSLPSPAPSSPYPAAMSVFNGLNPNGVWSLYVVDRSAGDAGNVAGGWSLSVSVVSPVNQVADLGVVAVALPNPVLVADGVTCIFTITNAGPSAATGVSFTNIVPAGAVLLSASSSQGLIGTNGGSVLGSLGTINVGAVATVTVVVRPTVAGLLSLTGSTAASETDLNLSNNSGSASTTVNLPVADLSISGLASTNAVVVGSNLTYSVSVTNLGPQPALNVVITDPLPAGLSFVSTTAGSFSNSAGIVTVNLGNLAAGGFATFDLVVNASGLGTLTNVISGSTGSTDNNAANNAVPLVVVVGAPAPIIASASSALVYESSTPPNATVDIGETVIVSLSLKNVGTVDTANLVATLLNTGGVFGAGAPQTYGVLTAGGASTARSYSFTATGTNGGTVVATLQLQDGASDLGTVTFTFNLPGTASFTNATAIVIPGQGSANPYPSTIGVSGVVGETAKAVVTLNGLTHGFPSDVDILLVSPTGKKLVLMSDAGAGHGITNVTLTFDDAGGALPNSTAIFTGTFAPTDYQPGDIFPPPAPGGPVGDNLGVFNSASPNGTWSLYVADDSMGDSGIISNGWTLTLTTVNPVNPVADLEVAVNGSPGSLYVGSAVTYNVTIVNNGGAAATGVKLVDTLPSGMSLVSAGSSQGSFTNSGNLLTFNIGSLAASASATASIRAVASNGGNLVNFATVSGVESDLNSANNTVQTTTTVNIPARANLTDVVYTNAQLQFTLIGDAGMTYVIQSSTNLTTWTAFSTNTAAGNGTVKFTDSSASGSALRFYRAVRLVP